MNQRYGDSTNLTAVTEATGQPGRIAFVQSCWHKEIVDQCRESFIAEIGTLGIAKTAIDFFEVPGSFEIPLQAKILAKSGRYAAIVADTVIGALMRVQLDTEVPIISAVLTPQHFHDHDEHRKFFHAHFVVKGREAATACVSTIENMNRLKKLCA